MLEARIVAARIHGAVAGEHGETHGAARMNPTSDGPENPLIADQGCALDRIVEAVLPSRVFP
jgi:hypothetical protein